MIHLSLLIWCQEWHETRKNSAQSFPLVTVLRSKKAASDVETRQSCRCRCIWLRLRTAYDEHAVRNKRRSQSVASMCLSLNVSSGSIKPHYPSDAEAAYRAFRIANARRRNSSSSSVSVLSPHPAIIRSAVSCRIIRDSIAGGWGCCCCCCC